MKPGVSRCLVNCGINGAQRWLELHLLHSQAMIAIQLQDTYTSNETLLSDVLSATIPVTAYKTRLTRASVSATYPRFFAAMVSSHSLLVTLCVALAAAAGKPRPLAHRGLLAPMAGPPRAPLPSPQPVTDVNGTTIPPYDTFYYFDQLIDHKSEWIMMPATSCCLYVWWKILRKAPSSNVTTTLGSFTSREVPL